MKKILKIRRLSAKRNTRGDTIVEVLIAIAVAAFAISISYAIANQSLQHAIAAHERNEALNIIENQITDLKARYKYTFFSNPGLFNSRFPALGGVTRHYCLLDSAIDPNAANWLPMLNGITSPAQAETLASPPYNDTGGSACIRHASTTDYYIDIAAEVTSSSAGKTDPTVYEISVRWNPVGGGQNQHAVIYYRF